MPDTPFLRLASENHAIKEAVISLFFASPIVQPRRFQSLLQELPEDFDAYQVAKAIRVELQGNIEESEVQSKAHQEAEIGFRLTKSDEGQIVRVLQGQNEDNRVSLSLHNLRYKRWDDFLETFLRVASALAPKLQNMIVIGFSLNYVDELEWIATGPIELERIFKRDSVYIPYNFFVSPNTELMLTFEDKTGNFNHFDRLQITSVVGPKSIVTIGHNIIHALTNTQDLSTLLEKKDSFKSYLQSAHEHNKGLLSSILQDSVQIKMGLKK
ncbi:hypothetical protein GCM10027594_11010 [Hymenobacter agri]